MKASKQGKKSMHVNSFGSQDAPREVGCENVNGISFSFFVYIITIFPFVLFCSLVI